MIIESLEEIADLLGVTQIEILQWKSEGFPGGQDQGFDVRRCVLWCRQHKWQVGFTADPDGDDLLGGEATTGLERYRNARADIAELERDERIGKLIQMEDCESALTQLAAILRVYQGQLRDQFGEAAGAVMGDCLSEFRDFVESQFGPG